MTHRRHSGSVPRKVDFMEVSQLLLYLYGALTQPLYDRLHLTSESNFSELTPQVDINMYLGSYFSFSSCSLG